MGLVITQASIQRIVGIIAPGAKMGVNVLVDGRGTSVSGYEDVNWIFPTMFKDVPPNSDIAKTEIFGTVLSLMHAQNIDEAINLVNSGNLGNMACIFTSSGAVARQYRYKADAGN